MNSQYVIVERENHVGKIILNRPEALNSLSLEMASGVTNALLELEADRDIHVVIIKSTGRAFCAGVDIKEFSNKTASEYRNQFPVLDKIIRTIPSMTKTVIAQVHGYATAAGCGIVAACDLAIASDDAFFGTTAINVGLFCTGPSAPLSRCVGRKKSLEMLLTGDLIDAQEAYRVGLVNKVVPSSELESATMELAEKLAAKPPLALQMGKQSFYTMSDLEYNKALDYLAEVTVLLAVTEDYREGVTAFSEKRAPHWKGC